jgi:hypothetical protein
MKKFLYFASAAPDGTAGTEEVACFPADQLSHLEMASATQLRVYFESSQENDADSGIDAAHAVLTITTGMRLTAQDLREMNILKYYRLTRKWVCKTYGLKDADLELLIYLDCKGRFTRKDFIDGVIHTHGIKTDGKD